MAFSENQRSLLAQLDSAFGKRQTDHKRKCKRTMYAEMSHELNHLLPFKTLMKKITIHLAFFHWGDFITNVVLFKEIVLKLFMRQNGFLSIFLGSTPKGGGGGGA